MADEPKKTPRRMGGIPLGEFSGSNATEALHATIKQFTAKSEEQTTRLICLTWAIVLLTVVMLVEVGVQTWAILR
jgi:hypothetical protein